MIAGALAAIGGVLPDLFSIRPTRRQVTDMKLDAIQAVLPWRNPNVQRQGSVAGTICGLMFIYLLKNLLKQLDINTYIQQMIVAVLIMVVVLLQQRDSDKARKGEISI